MVLIKRKCVSWFGAEQHSIKQQQQGAALAVKSVRRIPDQNTADVELQDK